MTSGDKLYGAMNMIDDNVFEIISGYGDQNVTLTANMTGFPNSCIYLSI